MDRRYSTASRRDYVDSQLSRYRIDEKSGHSLRDIAWDVKSAFQLEKPPSAATIANDLKIIEERKQRNVLSDEASQLLHPDRFAEWRTRLFTAANGQPYETPDHQLAWFWLLYCLALKETLPEWVIEWFKDHDADLGEINDWVENQELLLTLWLLAPPRHGKTDLFRHACIFLMLINPNIRIMWQSLNLTVAQLTTAWIKRELESNADLINMYGPFYKDGNWSDKEFIIATRTINLASPTMIALGKTEGTLSRDADLIVVDDFVDEKASMSPTQVEKDVNNLKTQVLTRRETWTPVLGIGSHQRSIGGDAYEYMERHETEHADPTASAKTIFVKVKAHNYSRCRTSDNPDTPDDEIHGDWCILWPTMRGLWFLEAMRHDLGDVMYEVAYNQEARRSSITYFREETVYGDFQQPRWDDNLKRNADPDLSVGVGMVDRERSYGQRPACCGKPANALLVALGFDPAAGETRHAAESSLHVLGGCPHCERRYIIDDWHDRVSPERHPDIIDQFAAATRPHRVRIEINAYQKALARDPRLRRSAASRRYTIDEWQTDQRRDDPFIGVSNLNNHIEAGRLSVPFRSPHDQIRTKKLQRQMLSWPQKPNDMMFSLWLADLSLAELIAAHHNETPDYAPGYETMPQYLRDSARTVDLSAMWERE
jgi:hypothetical protein